MSSVRGGLETAVRLLAQEGALNRDALRGALQAIEVATGMPGNLPDEGRELWDEIASEINAAEPGPDGTIASYTRSLDDGKAREVAGKIVSMFELAAEARLPQL